LGASRPRGLFPTGLALPLVGTFARLPFEAAQDKSQRIVVELRHLGGNGHDVTATTNALAAPQICTLMSSLRALFLLNLRGSPRAPAPSKPAAGRHEAIEAQIRD
jgi:hypothetical protein